jgi:hypothetical protein
MPFVKGQSGNPAGRRRSFDTLRNLAQEILNEDDGGKTRVEKILRSLITDDPKKLLEIGYGKVPDELVSDNITHILVTWGDPNEQLHGEYTEAPQSTDALSAEQEQAQDSEGGKA